MDKNEAWRNYIKYLRLWAIGHEDYDEFCEDDSFLPNDEDD